MHRISVAGNDAAGTLALTSLGFSVRAAKRGSRSWRFETCRANFGELLAVAQRVARALPEARIVMNARFGANKPGFRNGNSLPCTAASAVRPGMAMFGRDGWEVVRSVETRSARARVYDLDVEWTHNFIAEGVATHNCIYSWRGAEIRNILSFEKEFPGATVVVLEENYRSTQNILAAANDIISKNAYRVEKTMFTKNTAGAPLALYPAFDETDEALYVARTIADVLAAKTGGAGSPQPRDIAVLYRANFQSRALEEALLNADIPYQVLGIRFFERAEVKDAISYVRAATLGTSPDIARIANTPARGIGKTTVLAMLTHTEARLSERFKGKVVDFRALLGRIKRACEELPPSQAMEYTIRESGIERALKEDKVEGAERLENLRELVALAARYDALPPTEGLSAFLENVALASEQDELKEEANAVRLMTVHASKGLEFPYVFITGLEEGLFPYESMGEEKRDEEEERRLMYVAVTRGGKKVHLSYAMSRALFGARSLGAPSRFIADIPQELIEHEAPERLGKTIYLD